MNYCTNCKKITNDYEEKTYWNKQLTLIIAHCEECGYFQYQYLQKNIEIQNSN